jgi:hypothetical protein
MNKALLYPTFLILLASATFAGAATNGFIVPAFRGTPNSQAGYWETFSVPVGAPGNLADRAGATSSAVLTQSDTNAFLTGSGNLYNLNGVSTFTLANATPFTIGTVVLQTRSLGSELDYGSVILTYTNDLGSQTLNSISHVELNRGNQPGLGATVSSLWQWDLSGLGATFFSISFRAAEPSLSFDSLTLDTGNQFTPLITTPFALSTTSPAIERWMYANNAAPCDRPAGSSFATFDDSAGVDARHAQHLLGWDTAEIIATNRGAAQYLVRRCRLTLTINRGNLFVFDPTTDDFRTYFETNNPSALPDDDAGRPIELFGAGFRHGYDARSFDQCAPFGTNAPAQRNAYAVSYSTNGMLVDVSNNVGKTNAAFPHFEAIPFAIGQTTNAEPGQLVPGGAKITFELNLSDPFVMEYVQSGLNRGLLRFMVSSLHTSGGQFGAPSYPDFATHFNEAVLEPTRLELEGVVVGGGDLDTDGLSDDWELFYLQTLTYSGADDPDSDGASNLAESRTGTDPHRHNCALRLVPFGGGISDPVTLKFPHVANRRYSLEFTEDFTDWQRITNAPLLFLEPGTAQWTDDGALTGGRSSKRFYRVAVENP